MKFLSLICACALFVTSATTAFAKDRSYKFTFNGHASEEIADMDDYAMMRAAEYALKKGYTHFVIENTRRYVKAARNGGGLGSRNSGKPKPRTELKIHVYDADPAIEGVYEAASTIQGLNTKYAE